MKRVNTSLTKTGILFSLVLLSPGVMAAESLNFNYTLPGALSLEPRLGLQTRACHALSDPMKIKFIVKDIDPANDVVNLKVNGSDVSSAMVPFKDNVNFIIPFKVDYTGSTTQTMQVVLPGTPAQAEKTEPTNGYCFLNVQISSWSATGGGKTFGYPPLTPGQLDSGWGKMVGDHCRQRLKDARNKMYFDYDKPLSEADPEVQKMISQGPGVGIPFLVQTQHNAFFKGRTIISPAVPAGPEIHNDLTLSPDSYNGTTGVVNQDITVHSSPQSGIKGVNFIKVNGEIDFDISQRNISSIELKIVKKGGEENVLRWARSNINDETTKNVLKLMSTGTITSAPSVGSNLLVDDMYSKNDFYTAGAKNGVFRGTLASRSDLNDSYKVYVEDNTPLSLPAGSRGDINLVNTDSVTLEVTKNNQTGEYSVLAYGVPLQFSDVLSAGKTVASAMSVRNICY
ncbi:hypothetical protein OOO55_004559 [Salmonella enterica]|nr:hypothetical protein [Salmonella enterica]